MDQELLNRLITIFGIVASIASTYYASKKLNVDKLVAAKVNTINDTQARTIATDGINSFESILGTFISNAENNLKPAILQDIIDGKVDKSELNNLTKIVTQQVIDQLAPDLTKLLGKTIVNLEGYVEAKVVEKLHKMKDEDGTSVTHTVISDKVSYSDSINNLDSFVEKLPEQIKQDQSEATPLLDPLILKDSKSENVTTPDSSANTANDVKVDDSKTDSSANDVKTDTVSSDNATVISSSNNMILDTSKTNNNTTDVIVNADSPS